MKRKSRHRRKEGRQEHKKKTLTAIEHEERESSSLKRRTQRALGKATRWFEHFPVLQVKSAQATLYLPSTFGKAHRQVNIARLKFFDSRDSKLGPANVCPQPLWGHDGVPHYEIKSICNSRCHKGVDELWVEWQGYDQSQYGWVARSSLLQDVPLLVHAFEGNPSIGVQASKERS